MGQSLHAHHRAVSPGVHIGHHLVGKEIRHLFFHLLDMARHELFQGQGNHCKVGLVFDQKVQVKKGQAVG